MLSRVADAVFWVNRYIERAENVARFVDVSQSLSLGGVPQWSPLVFASGDEELFQKLYGECTSTAVLQFLLFDERNSNSILSCLVKAREMPVRFERSSVSPCGRRSTGFISESVKPRETPIRSSPTPPISWNE